MLPVGHRGEIGNTGTERGQPGHLHHHLIRVRLAVDPPHSFHRSSHGCGWSDSDEVTRGTCSQRQEGA